MSVSPTLDSAARFLTDALVNRHAEETTALLRGMHTPDMVCEHSIRQAKELLAHAYDLEARLHKIWSEYRWT